jgi:hypothetical protein
MRSQEVVIDSIAGNDRSIRYLETSHDLLSVSNLSVQPFHLVIVMISVESDVWNVNRPRALQSTVFLFEGFSIIEGPISYESQRSLTG